MAELKEIRIPDLGSDDAAPVAEIFISPGQKVEAEEALMALESEKAVMEIPSPFACTITEIKVKEGDLLKSGDLIALAEGNDTLEEAQSEENKEAEPPVLPAKAVAGIQSSTGKVPHASPSVRRIAREFGVDLTLVNGTAPKGRIQKGDVQNYVKERLKSGAGSLPAAAYTDPALFGDVTEKKLSRIQKISGPHLHGSWVNIPHVTHYEQADITKLEEWRKELNLKQKDVKFSILAFVVKALGKAVQDYPEFNAVLSPVGESLLLRNYYNIGIAVDTPQGLIVPVLKDIDQKPLTQIVIEIKDLALRGQKGQLKASEMQGAGITVSNLGGIGGTAFTPIINPPEVAILGLSHSTIQPVWDGEQFNPALILPLSLSYDHRVIDGALAARFARRLAELLEDMKNILL